MTGSNCPDSSVMSVFVVTASATSSPPPKEFAPYAQVLLRDTASVNLEHQIAVKALSLGEKTLGSLIWYPCEWSTCPVSPAVTLGSLIFPCRDTHPCAPWHSTAQQSDLSSDSCLSGWGSTSRRDKWYLGLRSIPMPCLFLWSQCPRDLSWSPSLHQPNPAYDEVIAIMHLCCFPTHQMLSMEMGQLWPCFGNMYPGKVAVTALHPGQLSFWLHAAHVVNMWQLLSSTEGPATLLLTAGFFCEQKVSISGPCWIVCS